MRTIKKYPNRRLYDTQLSKYITLSHIRDLVIEKEPFVVIDKKSGDDITRAILMQVISEQEQTGEPVMTEDFLSQIIRTYGNAMPNVVSNYLEQSLRLFVNQQAQARDRVRKVIGIDPVDAVAGLAQRNFARWRAVQEEVFKLLNRKDDDKGTTRSKVASANDDEH
ncbi:MAG: polyhydroxyalkanoate synthesis repressor PhaR [Gammaproteobacteria bacterium]